MSQAMDLIVAMRRKQTRFVASGRVRSENTTVGVAGPGLIGEAPLAEHRVEVHLGFTRLPYFAEPRRPPGRLRPTATDPACSRLRRQRVTMLAARWSGVLQSNTS
jgi:hypothetical protein